MIPLYLKYNLRKYLLTLQSEMKLLLCKVMLDALPSQTQNSDIGILLCHYIPDNIRPLKINSLGLIVSELVAYNIFVFVKIQLDVFSEPIIYGDIVFAIGESLTVLNYESRSFYTNLQRIKCFVYG